MEVPWEQLQPETLRALVEEYVTRDGTDYGHRELSLEAKAEDVMRMLRKHLVCVVFDADSQSCDIRSVEDARRPAPPPVASNGSAPRRAAAPSEPGVDQRRASIDEAGEDQRSPEADEG